MDGSIDYNQLEKPTVMRKHASISNPSTVSTASKSTAADIAADMEYLDIPAFLRRKEEAESG